MGRLYSNQHSAAEQQRGGIVSAKLIRLILIRPYSFSYTAQAQYNSSNQQIPTELDLQQANEINRKIQ